jgi:tyrosyl-tRNA synthetase
VKEWVLPPESKAFRQVLIQLKLASSGAEADQKLKQGAVKVDGTRVDGPFDAQEKYLNRGQEHVVEVGRRAYLLRVS